MWLRYVYIHLFYLLPLNDVQEKAITFRRYVTLHIFSTLATFSIAATWIVMSATRHATAQSNCESSFFPSVDGSNTSAEGQALCKIFPWIDVGIMGGLWVVLAIAQVNFWMYHHSFHSKPSSVLFLYDNFVIFLRARARPREL